MADLSGPRRDELEQRLEQLRAQVQSLEADLQTPSAGKPWWPQRFYLAYHVVIGAMLGLAAAGASLLFNVLGSLMVNQHPLQFIRVLLTFPLGEEALQLEGGFTLSAGCFLYLGTGIFFGAFVHVVLARYFAQDSIARRFLLAGGLGLGLWVVNFYGVLSWLQPLLFDGRWVLSEMPAWVAAATHLVFAWTVVLLGGMARFEPPAPTPMRA